MLTRLLRHVLVPSNVPAASRERRRLAYSLERIAQLVDRRRGPHLSPARIQPEVAAACAEPASAVAAALRDPDVVVRDDALVAVRRFLTDGCSSPLYGRSPVDALLAIGELERSVVLTRLPHALGR